MHGGGDGDVVERLPYRARKWLVQRATGWRGGDQLDRLADTDWDVCVVADACRLDALRAVADWPVERVRSPASCTPEWLPRVADSGVFDGATVLTANPQYEKFDFPDTALEHVWRDAWDESRRTVPAEAVLERVDERLAGVDDGHPDPDQGSPEDQGSLEDQDSPQDQGPVVAHLNQPHWPYVAKLDDEWRLACPDLGPWESADGEVASVQAAMERGLLDVSAARRAYESSVASTWATLAPALDRWAAAGHTVVVTADHGETFGRLREAGLYEHACGCHLAPLVDVPWVQVGPEHVGRDADGDHPDAGERDASEADDSGADETGDPDDDDAVQDRLEALGYAE